MVPFLEIKLVYLKQCRRIKVTDSDTIACVEEKSLNLCSKKSETTANFVAQLPIARGL